MKNEVANLRINYTQQVLFEKDILENPLDQFEKWFQDALAASILEPNAMVLSTVSGNKPSSRVLLLKGFDQRGFVFYTNYLSNKGKQIALNPNASMNFFWDKMERQVRIEGKLEKVSAEESDVYFQSRPHGSKVGAWVSEQSAVIPNRAILEEKLKKLLFDYPEGSFVPRPPHWGGYLLVPAEIEFWQGGPNRLHDRIRYFKQDAGWHRERLSP